MKLEVPVRVRTKTCTYLIPRARQRCASTRERESPSRETSDPEIWTWTVRQTGVLEESPALYGDGEYQRGSADRSSPSEPPPRCACPARPLRPSPIPIPPPTSGLSRCSHSHSQGPLATVSLLSLEPCHSGGRWAVGVRLVDWKTWRGFFCHLQPEGAAF